MRTMAALVLVTVILSGCAPRETTRTGPPPPERVRPPSRGTYTLVPFNETVAVGVFNKEVLEGIEIALREALEKKGYRQGEEGEDILVAFYVIREGRFQAHDWGYGRGWKTPEWDGYWLERRAAGRDLDEGTIVIDFIDPQGKTLTWTGSAPSVLLPAAEGEVRNEAAERAVAEIIEACP